MAGGARAHALCARVAAGHAVAEVVQLHIMRRVEHLSGCYVPPRTVAYRRVLPRPVASCPAYSRTCRPRRSAGGRTTAMPAGGAAPRDATCASSACAAMRCAPIARLCAPMHACGLHADCIARVRLGRRSARRWRAWRMRYGRRAASIGRVLGEAPLVLQTRRAPGEYPEGTRRARGEYPESERAGAQRTHMRAHTPVEGPRGGSDAQRSRCSRAAPSAIGRARSTQRRAQHSTGPSKSHKIAHARNVRTRVCNDGRVTQTCTCARILSPSLPRSLYIWTRTLAAHARVAQSDIRIRTRTRTHTHTHLPLSLSLHITRHRRTERARIPHECSSRARARMATGGQLAHGRTFSVARLGTARSSGASPRAPSSAGTLSGPASRATRSLRFAEPARATANHSGGGGSWDEVPAHLAEMPIQRTARNIQRTAHKLQRTAAAAPLKLSACSCRSVRQ